MCLFFGTEDERRYSLCCLLREFAINVNPGPVAAKKCMTDGHVLHGKHPTLIQELKNEIGSLGAEPSLQALVYYDTFMREFWSDTSTCHPCFVIFVAGELDLTVAVALF
jgi:hypothetical protein